MTASPGEPAPFDLVLRPGDELFELTRSGHYLLLSDDGVFLGRGHRSRRARFVPWSDITHIAHSRRALWLGTRGTVQVVTRGRHSNVSIREITIRMEARIARLPGGMQQLSRMRENDVRLRDAHAPIVTFALIGLCFALHLLQISDAFVSEIGAFARDLVGEGELWRIVTAHFLHDVTWAWITPETASGVPLLLRFPGHIVMNCLAALVLGRIVEQSLGSRRTIFVLGLAALGSVSLSALMSPSPVIGASGMVLGLAGAVLALELSMPERLPANWRIPRRLLIAALVLQLIADQAIPFIAASAHLGGLVGGYVGARLVGGSGLRQEENGGWLPPAVLALGVAAAVAFTAAAPLVLRMGWAFNRHAENILALEHVGADTLNNLAWRIATETDAFPEAPDRAIALAERAVDATERANPDYLDTLAEVQFLSGDPMAAMMTIDEAIEIAPWDPYFHEQRDRFTGLRDPEDRPAAPDLPWFLRGPSEPAPWDEGLGVEI